MQGRIEQVHNIKIFRSALRLCAAISEEELMIVTGSDKFCLKASNDSLTTIVAIDFTTPGFFSEFNYNQPETDPSFRKPEQDVVTFNVKSRLILQSMRLLGGIKALHMVNQDENGYFVICFISDEGCRRAYYFNYEQADTPIARIENFQKARFRCQVKPKFLHDAIRNFSSKLPEIRFMITRVGVQIRALDDAGPENDHVETELFLNSFDMNKYEFEHPEENLTVRIPACEIRAMIQFCMATDTLLQLECQEPGQPVLMTSLMNHEKINFSPLPFTAKILVQTVFEDNYITRPQAISLLSTQRRQPNSSFSQSVEQAAASIRHLEASQVSLPTFS